MNRVFVAGTGNMGSREKAEVLRNYMRVSGSDFVEPNIIDELKKVRILTPNILEGTPPVNIDTIPVSLLAAQSDHEKIRQRVGNPKITRTQLTVSDAVNNLLTELPFIFECHKENEIIGHSQWGLIVMETVINNPGLLEFIDIIRLITPSTGYKIEYSYHQKRVNDLMQQNKGYLHEWGFYISPEFLLNIDERKDEPSTLSVFTDTLNKFGWKGKLIIAYSPKDDVIHTLKQPIGSPYEALFRAGSWGETMGEMIVKVDWKSLIDSLVPSQYETEILGIREMPDRSFLFSPEIIFGWHTLDNPVKMEILE